MRIVVTGSIAVDHLATFPGKFAEQLIPGQLDKISLSFLTDQLEVHYGGVAANIATGLGRLGQRPLLAGAAGKDFGAYREWLEREGVDTEAVLVSETEYTARFWCTTDTEQNQIASFHPGAMAAAAGISLRQLAARVPGIGVVVIGANAPDAMLAHTAECRELGLPFAADPSQQLALLDGADIRRLVDGARYLFTNEYEHALLLKKTGWSESRVLSAVGAWITTLGEAGARIDGAPGQSATVREVPATEVVDPTGAGDGFRAGFLAARNWGLPHAAAARLGCLVATCVLESKGTAEYRLDGPTLLERLAGAYGKAPAAQLTPHLATALAAGRLGGHPKQSPVLVADR
ncbi:carbohydrate kinase family protein [Amycolatopsis sp. 195334CR]|uniref:carbohydrate kinase family protein n=1 Tax=Amycolatopsis sp. 195334CR TaxID=2814588 RepID=UPI001A900713|nr:carbohydrate kinase family protein [Amycolatopsis sp. 195334CR]MBN6038815.1 carbohydrate kinase family protein [Amycolatopsis sp. 195334CR]